MGVTHHRVLWSPDFPLPDVCRAAIVRPACGWFTSSILGNCGSAKMLDQACPTLILDFWSTIADPLTKRHQRVMRRSLSLLAVVALLLFSWPSRADEPPEVQLDFARKLRSKHYADLALEYLDKLRKTAPPALQPDVLLETARARVNLAQDKEPDQRAPLFAQARKELEAFLAANGEHPEAPRARVEVARLAALQGKALLSSALRQETKQAQIDGALQARQQFADAGKELETAVKQLTDLKEKYTAAKSGPEKLLKDKAEESYLQVMLDRATNFLDQAETYIDQASDATLRERAEVIEEAKKTLRKVEEQGAKAPESTLARAWLVRCLQLTDAPKEAANQFKKIMNEVGPKAKAGQRLGWYFYIRGLHHDPSFTKDKNKEIIKQASGWLKDFADFRNTPEGQQIRLELAKAQIAEAEGLKGAAAAKLMAQAEKELAALAAMDSDIASQASDLHVTVSVERLKAVPLEKIRGFDDCYLKARYEIYLLQKNAEEAEKKSGKELAKLEVERKQHLKDVLEALKRALRQADDKTSPQPLAEARRQLTFVYLLTGDPYRAALLGESLARAEPVTKGAAAAAGYALDAYGAILSEPSGNTESTRARLRGLADFVLKNRAGVWRNDPVIALARYQLALVSLRDHKFLDAIDALEKLPPSFSSYVLAQTQLAQVAIAAAREAKSDAERTELQERALKALDRIPKLPPGADPRTVENYFAAQVEKGGVLYSRAAADLQKGDIKTALQKYEDMEKFAASLLQQFKKTDTKLGAEVRDGMQKALANLKKNAQFGLANTEYRAGNFDKVLALTEDAVKSVKALDKRDSPIVIKDYRVTGSLLGLNLRARVQKGAVAEAKEMLPLLRRLKGEDQDNDATAVLQSLVQDLRGQVKALQEKAKTDPAAKMQLDAMAESFTTFLKELSKQSDEKSMMQNLFFIANCYSSLAKHKEAADLFAQIPEPKGASEEKEGTYWFIQLQRARELRLAGKELLEAMKPADAARMFAEARGVLGRIPAKFRSFPVQQEEIFQLQDQNIYGTAISRWSALMKSPYLAKRVATDNEAKKQYFDCFYYFIYCWYEYGKNNKTPAKQTEYIRKAADYIVRLETAPNQDGWQLIGGRLNELLRAEPPLRAQYEQLKKTVH